VDCRKPVIRIWGRRGPRAHPRMLERRPWILACARMTGGAAAPPRSPRKTRCNVSPAAPSATATPAATPTPPRAAARAAAAPAAPAAPPPCATAAAACTAARALAPAPRKAAPASAPPASATAATPPNPARSSATSPVCSAAAANFSPSLAGPDQGTPHWTPQPSAISHHRNSANTACNVKRRPRPAQPHQTQRTNTPVPLCPQSAAPAVAWGCGPTWREQPKHPALQAPCMDQRPAGTAATTVQ
jgi:hypothetical protein